MSNTLEIGKTFGGGRYVVEKVIGAGGFGITYFVRHVELNVHYAVKEFFISGKCVRESDRSTVFLQDIDPDRYAKLKKRFADEARTLVSLNNPHVVRVIDIFDENNTSYIVMEYVPGITLQQKIETEGKMSFMDAVNCMGQLAEAVSYIHSKHVLHRDIKPDNVIITPDNRVVLIDFGSAREFVHDEVQNQTAILTRGYAPLEQYSTTSKKGNYTDIYALGGVFYFLLTGVKPIDATERTIETLKSPRELNPEISEDISKTIMKAMELKPEDRYQSVQEFVTDLLGDLTVTTDDETGTPQKKKSLTWLWILLGVFFMLAVGVTAAVVIYNRTDDKQEVVDEARMERFRRSYDKRVQDCERAIGSIVKDKDGNVGNKFFIIQALDKLKEIEQDEQDPDFKQSGCTPMFKHELSSYRTELKQAKQSVNDELGAYLALQIDDVEDNIYYIEQKEKISLIDEVLRQSENGSVADVQLRQ